MYYLQLFVDTVFIFKNQINILTRTWKKNIFLQNIGTYILHTINYK